MKLLDRSQTKKLCEFNIEVMSTLLRFLWKILMPDIWPHGAKSVLKSAIEE